MGGEEQRREREDTWQVLTSSSFQNNRHAGITVPEDLSSELSCFFPRTIFHGGRGVNADTDAWEYRAFRAPFISGASGSILYVVLAMEDTMGGRAPNGAVPLENREVLL